MLVDPSTIMFPLQLTNLGLLAPTAEEVKDVEDTLAFDAVEPTQASPHETHGDDGGDGFPARTVRQNGPEIVRPVGYAPRIPCTGERR